MIIAINDIEYHYHLRAWRIIRIRQRRKRPLETRSVAGCTDAQQAYFEKGGGAWNRGRLLIPGDEEFLELTWAGKRIVVNRTRSHRMPLLAGLLAKNKAASNLLFARSGLPVPAYTVVSGPGEEALQFWRAHRLVTVKPLDASRSAGVTIRVRSEDELVGAVRRALVHSDRVMLQKYVHGSDYRVLIVGGRVVGALEYRAASVEGDGKSTLGQLIERLNAEQASRSRRAGAVGSYLPVDVLGETLQAGLAQAGRGLADVPAVGERVRLFERDNMAASEISEVPFDRSGDMHPDHARVAVEAAAALALDVAGVDIRCRDIRQPLDEENGGLLRSTLCRT